MKCLTKTLIAFIITGLIGCISVPQGPINSPAIQEWQQTQHLREILSPSVFAVQSTLFVSEKDTVTGKEKTFSCAEERGTSFSVSEKGYFITNNHLIDTELIKTNCLAKLAKKRNVPASSFSDLKFEMRYFLTDFKKKVYPFTVEKTFPEKDIAVLKYSGENTSKKWIPVEFRTGSPKVVNGEIVSVKGPMTLSDEPVMVMGMPLSLPFTLTKGMLGNGLFQQSREETFIHFIAPINSGNSGGPLVSLLDYKVIGMTTMAKRDRQNMSEQSGATPFWVIQDALKKVEIK